LNVEGTNYDLGVTYSRDVLLCMASHPDVQHFPKSTRYNAYTYLSIIYIMYNYNVRIHI